MGLQTLDFVVIFVYMAGLFALGIYFSRQQTSKEEYFLGDRKIPWFLAGVSVLATLLSTLSYLSVPGEMIRYGIGFFASLLAFIFVIPAVNIWIIPGLMGLHVTSVYEYLEQRFDRSVRDVGAIVFIVTRFIWMGLIIYTASFALSTMTGWGIPWLILVIGIVTTFYTSTGGLRAVIWSDFAQFVILTAGAILIPVYVAVVTGGGPLAWWATFSEAGRTTVPIFSWDPTVRMTLVGILISTFVWNMCTHGADQVAAQRYLSTPSVKAAKRSVWVFAICNVTLIGTLMVCGLALFFLYFQRSVLPIQEFQTEIAARADKVLPEFIATELPTGFSGLLLAALLAAAMSSLSSGINSVSTVAVTDLLPRVRVLGKYQDSLRLATAVAVLAGGFGTACALLVNVFMRSGEWNILELMGRVNHLFVAPLAAMFFAGMFLRRVGSKAVLTGFLMGVLASIVIAFSKELFGLERGISFMWIIPASFVVSFFVAQAAGFLFPLPSAKSL